MKKRVVVIASVLLIATMLGGCGHKMKENVTLTDRQCDILLSEDLPTDWNKLTASQRNSIQAIEEMLEYVENKYDKTFIYAGYRRADFTNADGEALLVYAEGDDPDTDCFTVERTEDGFEDDYGVVLAQDGYHEKLEEAVSGYLEGKTYKLLSEVGKIDEKKGFPRGTVYLFINSYDIGNRIDATTELESILFSIDGVDNVRIFYLLDVNIEVLTIDNWEDEIEKENIVELVDATGRQWRKEHQL